MRELDYPFDFKLISRRRKQICNELRARQNLRPLKIAILGGSTTSEIRSYLELFVLNLGFNPSFYESDYNLGLEEVVQKKKELFDFDPEIVLIHTNWRNIRVSPAFGDGVEAVSALRDGVLTRFGTVWSVLERECPRAIIIQNNFDSPHLLPFGHLENSSAFGIIHFIRTLNDGLSKYAQAKPQFLINDISTLSMRMGEKAWFDPNYWYSYKMAISPEASAAVSYQVSRLIAAVFGLSKKCLVLDLDNTIWGGVIGDDGLNELKLSQEGGVGEAFLEFQKYLKALKAKGVILAVASKNDFETAKLGFSHPDSVLCLSDFAAFKASWKDKTESLLEIATELNIGLDSLVFVDDNPAERELIRLQLPEVSTPEIGADVVRFSEILDRAALFEPFRFSKEDAERATYYEQNKERERVASKFQNYDEYLASLEMVADIRPFEPIYLERIAQLINKTNQFNLTTKRYTQGEVESLYRDEGVVSLLGRLTDKFGDNGLVSVIIGRIRSETPSVLDIEVWLMSCRVIKRGMELAMFDALIERCRENNIQTIFGYYYPTKKNGMVSEFYSELGFERTEDPTKWKFSLTASYQNRNRFIRRANVQNS